MKDQFSQIVSKSLAGEASDVEKKALTQMLLESSDSSLIYNQIKEYWNADVKMTDNRDKINFENKLVRQLSLESREKKPVFRRLYIRFASAAALIFFVATCSLAYLYNVAPHHLYTYSAQNEPMDYLLADGTKVTLNKNSSITFSSDYGDKRRDVRLNGEAFFKVTKDKTKPFSVEALGTRTQVLGTSFNVQANVVSGAVTTTLVEGSVLFKSPSCEVLLKPGKEIVYNTKSNTYSMQDIDTQFNTSWTIDRFNYENLTFAKLAKKLEYIYKVKIHISDQKIANRIVSASFLKNESIEEILNALEEELSFKFAYRMKDSTQINIINKTLNK